MRTSADCRIGHDLHQYCRPRSHRVQLPVTTWMEVLRGRQIERVCSNNTGRRSARGPGLWPRSLVKFLGLSIFTADRAYILRYFLCDPVTVAEARPVFVAGPGQARSSGDFDSRRRVPESATSAPCHDAISAPHPTPKGPDGPYQIQVPDVAALTRKGYAVSRVSTTGFFAAPATPLSTSLFPAVQDGKAALRFLRANAAKYGLDPEKFAVWGNSAGGFIAAMLALTGHEPTIFDDPALGNSDTSSAVQAAVIWYGAIEVNDLSIAHYTAAAKIIPPILIANGDADTSVPGVQDDPVQRRTAKERGEVYPHDFAGRRS